MKTRYLSYLILILSIVIVFSSCRKDKGSPRWDVDLLTPILKTELTIKNMVNSDDLIADSTGMLKLVFNNNLVNFSLDTLIQFPDTVVTERIDQLFNTTFAPGIAVPIGNNKESIISINDAELVFTTIKSGTIDITIKSSLIQPLIIDYELTSATKNGNPFIISVEIPAGTLTNASGITNSYSLEGYNIDLKGAQNNSFNTLVANIVGQVVASGDTLNPLINDYIEISYQFNNVKPSYAKGYFGQINSDVAMGTESFDFLANVVSGGVNLEEVDMKLQIKNGIGVDIQTTINEITMRNTKNNKSASLNHNIINSQININKATETFIASQPVIYQYYNIAINTDNSNIDALFEVLPNQIEYDVAMNINPLGHTSSYGDFFFDTESIAINLNMEIPLKFSLENLLLSDTVEIKIGEKTVADRYLITDGFLNIYGVNSYPFKVVPQLYFLDSNYVMLDSIILENNYFDAGITTANNTVIEPFESKIAAPLNLKKINTLFNAKYMKINVGFSTDNPPSFATIYDSYSVQLKVVADFNYVIDPNKNE